MVKSCSPAIASTIFRPDEMRKVRGKRIGMIFQDPLTSLNPLYRVGEQLIETIRTHTNMSASAARKRAIELLAEVGIPAPGSPRRQLSA